MNSVGIDIGTTSICGVLVDCKSGKLIKSVTLPNDSFIKTSNGFERIQDCEKIIAVVKEIAALLCDEKTASIGFSNQMHGVLYADKSMNALSPLYTWQDSRGAIEYKNQKTYAQTVGSFSGYGLVSDFYNRENNLVPKNTAYIMTIGDFAAAKLCGSKKPLMHITNAAGLGLFDIEKNQFNIDLPYLPSITKEFCVVGEYNKIPVTVPIGDNQASFIGSVKSNHMALVNVGTGSQISFISPLPKTNALLEARPFDGENFLTAGCALCGGRALALVERFFAKIAGLSGGDERKSFYPIIDKILQEKTTTTLLADSRFCGTRADSSIRGSLTNIGENNFTPEDMLLAVLQASARELHDMYISANASCSALVCSGNAIRKNLALQKITSKLFEKEILIPLYKEEAAYGAALTSMAGCGLYKNINQARQLICYEENSVKGYGE